MDLGSATLTLFQVAIELEYAKSMFDLHKKSHPNDEIVGWWVNVLLMISCRLFTWCHRLENSPLDCRILLLNVNHLRFFLNLKSFFFLFLLINNFYFYFFFFNNLNMFYSFWSWLQNVWWVKGVIWEKFWSKCILQ